MSDVYVKYHKMQISDLLKAHKFSDIWRNSALKSFAPCRYARQRVHPEFVQRSSLKVRQYLNLRGILQLRYNLNFEKRSCCELTAFYKPINS